MSTRVGTAEVFSSFHRLLPAHWQRRRGLLGPPQVFLSLMTMAVLGTKGYDRTIHEMKTRLGDVIGWNGPGRRPSASALCQARRKLDAQQCAALSAQISALCTTARAHASLGYGGMRLVAADGTKLALPAYKAMIKHFGAPTTATGAQHGPQASFTLLWDVGANLPIAWRLGPYRVSERVHAMELVASLRSGDLLLTDRGLVSRRMMLAVLMQGAHFLMRICCSGKACLREVAAFLATGQVDALVTVQERDHHGQPKPDAPPIRVRLLRMAVHDDPAAVFITSLCDQAQHPTNALLALYVTRWRVETAFRELKLWHGLERFHARHVDGIAQEVCALMVFQMLASELEARARVLHGIESHQIHYHKPEAEGPPLPTTPPIRFNRRIVADSTVDLIYAATISEAAVAAEFQEILLNLWRYRQAAKPRRSFPRERKSPPRGWKPKAGSRGKGRAR